MSLSERLRPDVEAAPWVIEEVKALEAEIEQLRAFFEAVSERSDEQRHIEASAEIERLQNKLVATATDLGLARADLDLRNAEIERLREDTVRLEWLLRKLPGDALRYCVGELADTADANEFRAKIDAALNTEKGK